MIVYRPIPPLSAGRSNSLWSVFAAMASAALLGPAWPSGTRRVDHQEAVVSTPRR
ncbi:hypothetical protein KNN17_07370 [Arthrobacter bambusae]|jgi:hypothetical protein|uniref:hypothetical protein n=1 Tax=Arthrobacter TaxID=1663 RepID=UPI0015C52DCD|nr:MULTISPECIES: hypothetical protein [Arthrobacter]MCI0141397.1 hypothetical protein [Arthrobacter bambusae]MDQ0211746.1 hypothetical protein [Arthrobacter bambusae]MDQ0236312.1 hypothetical protein [Arthrobacter bambusae]UYY82247.1 hypothetical protein OIT41_04080 [Arthrobacter sp. YA7-1]